VETPQGTTYEGKRFHRQRVRRCPGPAPHQRTAAPPRVPTDWGDLVAPGSVPVPARCRQGLFPAPWRGS